MNLLRRGVQERGTALIVVMVLLAIMCVFMFSTTQAIFLVKRELQLIEKRQLERYERPAASAVQK